MEILITQDTIYAISAFFITFYKFYTIGETIFDKYYFQQRDFINFTIKIISIIHTILICILCYKHSIGNIEDEIFVKRIDITKGYLIYDIFCMLYNREYVLEFDKLILHHSILLAGLYTDKLSLYPAFVSQGFMAEITNLPLTLGWFLIKKGKQNTLLFYTNAVFLLGTFFVYRVLNFTDLFLKSLNMTDQWYEIGFVFIIMILNILWFIKLLDKFFKTLLRRS